MEKRLYSVTWNFLGKALICQRLKLAFFCDRHKALGFTFSRWAVFFARAQTNISQLFLITPATVSDTDSQTMSELGVCKEEGFLKEPQIPLHEFVSAQNVLRRKIRELLLANTAATSSPLIPEKSNTSTVNSSKSTRRKSVKKGSRSKRTRKRSKNSSNSANPGTTKTPTLGPSTSSTLDSTEKFTAYKGAKTEPSSNAD